MSRTAGWMLTLMFLVLATAPLSAQKAPPGNATEGEDDAPRWSSAEILRRLKATSGAGFESLLANLRDQQYRQRARNEPLDVIPEDAARSRIIAALVTRASALDLSSDVYSDVIAVLAPTKSAVALPCFHDALTSSNEQTVAAAAFGIRELADPNSAVPLVDYLVRNETASVPRPSRSITRRSSSRSRASSRRGLSRTTETGFPRAETVVWETLTNELWSPDTLGLLVDRFSKLGSQQREVLRLVQEARRTDLATQVFEHFASYDEDTRSLLLETPRGGEGIVTTFIGEASAQAAVVAAIEDPSMSVRIAALSQLDFRPLPSDAVPALMRCYDGAVGEDRSIAGVRARVVGVLAHTNDPRALPVLMAALEERSEEVSREALGATRFSPSRGEWSRLWLDAVKDGAWPDFDVVGALIQAVEAPVSLHAANNVCEALSRAVSPDVAPRLAAVLSKIPADARPRAIKFLGDCGNPGVVAALLQQSQLPDQRIREVSVAALGKYAVENATAGIVEALADESAFVRESAARALAGREEEPLPSGAASLLFPLLESSRQSARLAAVEALAIAAPTEAIVEAVSQTLRRDSEVDVALAAIRALGRLGTPQAVDALAQHFASEQHSRALRATAEALAKVADPRVLPAVVDRLSLYHSYPAQTEVVGKEPNATTRVTREAYRYYYVIENLSSYPGDAVVDAVADYVNGSRFASASMLAALADVVGRFQTQGAYDQLGHLMKNRYSRVRLAAVKSAAQTVSPSLIPGLIARLRDTNADVRRAAQESIEAIQFVRAQEL